MFIGTSNTAKDFNRIAHANRGIAPPGHRTSDKGLYGLKSQCNPGHLGKKIHWTGRSEVSQILRVVTSILGLSPVPGLDRLNHQDSKQEGS
jgi:hypothetical protein